MDAHGKVLGDSEEDPAQMENHRSRPEVREAVSGAAASSTRFSRTLGLNMMYVAVPLMREGRVEGVVRASMPLSALDERLSGIRDNLLLLGLATALAAALASLWVSSAITRPIREMTAAARRFAVGDLSVRMRVPGARELGSLAETMNAMARQLGDWIVTVTRQKNELEAVLSSMMEGVIAVDRNERILRMNQAAARLLGRSPADYKGLPVASVLRTPGFQEFVDQALEGARIQEKDFVLQRENERMLSVRAAPLLDADGQLMGVLIVISDVTRLRRLENMRRDFVSNVSHEMKTPLTAIQGFVETLRETGMEDPEQSRRFLDIVARHVQRLGAIIEDLLALSRIEHEKENQGLKTTPHDIHRVVQTAVSVCQTKAAERGIRVIFEPGQPLVADVDYTLMEQAVINILDNAIKYSPENGRVALEARRENGAIAITCSDEGPGIAREHLSRIFERFYRVDKARSRDMGGTGLGLAIVKHVAQAHGGRVEVQSTLGKGSAFSIFLPTGKEADSRNP